MSWAVGYDSNWKRDIGYGVPATCDHPGCGKEIDRGLSHVCGGKPYGGSNGCGLYFCSEHLFWSSFRVFLCARCSVRPVVPFDPTPDLPKWMRHKLKDKSWAKWRKENPEEVEQLKTAFKRRCNMSGSAQRTTALPPATGSATRHEMVSAAGPAWCKLCGTFDVYCFMANGEMTECHPKPPSERWWNPKSQNEQVRRDSAAPERKP